MCVRYGSAEWTALHSIALHYSRDYIIFLNSMEQNVISAAPTSDCTPLSRRTRRYLGAPRISSL